MGETKGKSADDLMYELIAFSFKMDTAVAAIAFVYGVTEQQVARDMHSALNHCSSGCSDGCPMLDDGCTVSSGELRSRLEALGVNLGD